jgi:hypothetical protein
MKLYIRSLFIEDHKEHETVPYTFQRSHNLQLADSPNFLVGQLGGGLLACTLIDSESDEFGHRINDAFCWRRSVPNKQHITSLGVVPYEALPDFLDTAQHGNLDLKNLLQANERVA